MADQPRGASATADRPCGAGPPAGRLAHLGRRGDRYETDSGGRDRFCTHGACVPGRAVRGRAAASGARPFREEASHARGRPARCGRCARCRGKRVCLGRPSAGVCMRMGLARRVHADGPRSPRSRRAARALFRPCAQRRRVPSGGMFPCSSWASRCSLPTRCSAACSAPRRTAHEGRSRNAVQSRRSGAEPEGRCDCAARAAADHMVAAAAESTERRFLRAPASPRRTAHEGRSRNAVQSRRSGAEPEGRCDCAARAAADHMVAAAAESTERRFLRAPASAGGVKVGRTGGYGKRPAARTGCRPFWPGGWLRGAVARLRSRGVRGAGGLTPRAPRRRRRPPRSPRRR